MSSKLPEKSPSASTKKPASKPTSKAPVKRSLWTRIKDAVDPDYALQLSMAAMIEAAAVKHVLGLDQERWAPGKPLKLGKTVLRNNLNHLDAVDPQAREERAARERSLVDSLRERSAGRYAEGAVSDKLDAAREQRDAFERSQMGFFASEDLPEKKNADLAADERYTLGHAAERSLSGLMQAVGGNFKPGEPVKLFNPSMSGEFAARQRAIKYLVANKRMSAALGEIGRASCRERVSSPV